MHFFSHRNRSHFTVQLSMHLYRFATGRFSGLRRPTVGADFLSKKIEIHDCEVALQIWDTAGQERFHQGSLGNSFYRGAHGALLVYDVNNASSIEQIAQWRDECLHHQETDDYFPLVVVGNKVTTTSTALRFAPSIPVVRALRKRGK
jgi:small GTP-binding protein